MKKRVLSLLVALCLTLVLIPTVSADNVRPTTSTPQSSEIDTLSPNEALTVTIEPGNSVTFDFDFDTHGYYIFTSTAFDYYGIMSHPTLTISVKDADLCRSAEGELVFHSDEAAEFCYLSAENWSDSTISVTLLITQINAEQIQINSTITSDIVCGEYVEYLFTPEKSGVYTFYFAGKPKTGPHTLLNADIRINDNASFLSKTAVRYDSENPSNHFTLLQAELEAGDVYRYRLTNSPGFHEDDAYQTYVTTVEVSIAETVPIQSISMGTAFDDLWGFFYDNGHVYAYTGYGANLQAYIHPIHAQIEDIFWSSTNTAVATSDSSDSLVHISCIAPGNSIITATTASGLSASCEVNVYDQVTYNVVSDNDLVWTHIAGNDLHYDISPCANKVYKIKVYDENGVYYSTTADDYTINFHHTDEISRVTFHNDFL